MKYKEKIIVYTLVVSAIICLMGFYNIRLTNALLDGLLLGGLYGTIAIGMTIIFGVLKIINICQGEFLIFGAFMTLWLYQFLGIFPYFYIPIVFLLLFIIGYCVSRFIMNRAMKISPAETMLVAFGLSISITYLMKIAWTTDPRIVSIGFGSIKFLNFVIPHSTLFAFLSGACGLFIVHMFITKTKLGKSIRGVSLNPQLAELIGIKPERVKAIAYALGVALAGLAGVVFSTKIAFSPMSGITYFGRMMAVCIIGGIGHVFGAFFGGLTLGVCESIGAFFFGDGTRMLIAYFVLLIILVIKPTGLFAKRALF